MLSQDLFDSSGRCLANLTNEPAYKKSRKYFYIDEKTINEIDDIKIYNNLKKYFKEKILISFEDFKLKIKSLKSEIIKKNELKNIEKGIGIPFITPIINNHTDIGDDIDEILVPALEKSYKDQFPNYEFVNHCKESLKNNLSVSKDIRYDKILSKIKNENVVGILYFSLNEFSFPAAEEIVKKLPENFNLTGPYELFSAIIGFPNLLLRNEKYPPLIWLSSVRDKQNPMIGYHIEPYGYNLTFNRRPHLDHVAEYWWHSIALTD